MLYILKTFIKIEYNINNMTEPPQGQQQMSPEQVAELQEKIKNMSPEELKEFQKKQCIFCQIIDGKVQSKKIYEDNICFAALDINPANPGHILLMTKEHYSIMPQIPPGEISHVFRVSKSLSNSLLRGIEAGGTNILVANGVAAGQRAQHFMVHIIPRKENDGVDFVLPQKTLNQQQIDEVGNKIIQALGGKVEETKSVQENVDIVEPVQKQDDNEDIGDLDDGDSGSGESSDGDEDGGDESGDVNLDDISRSLGL
tara:strand:- start:1325 stop:2092 length:768 start_codon:yes stop_codon:yes gene_type:complete